MITSKENPKIKFLSRLLKDRDFRYSQSRYVSEGIKSIEDSKEVDEIYLREGVKPPEVKSNHLYTVKESVFRSISSTENSQGVVAVLPFHLKDLSAIRKDEKYVLPDQLQDPGNMGTIIRTAASFNVRGIIVPPGSVDPFSPKAVRASAGLVGKIDVIQIGSYEELSAFEIVAAEKGGSDARSFVWPKGFILAVGNEGRGLSEGLLAHIKYRVSIPIARGVDSLNAAVSAAILLFLGTESPLQGSIEATF